MAARPTIGQMFEFETPCGFAYLQYVLDDASYGSLARVLDGLFPIRPSEESLEAARTRFHVFVPIGPAWRAGDLVSVGALTIPTEEQAPRVFRQPLGLGGSNGWVFRRRDGHELGVKKQLTDAERQVPVWEVWTFGLLVARVASDWAWQDSYGPVPRAEPNRASPCYQIKPDRAS